MAWLNRHGVLSERTLCIHAIHVSGEDADLMAQQGCAVAHCPRSNRFHHAADAPVELYLARKLRVGLGTDSEISVAPTDLLAEARALRSRTGWSAATTIRTLTIGGAEAIARDGECGSLRPGKWGDLVAFQLEGEQEPEEAVLAAGPDRVQGTWLAGREVYRSGRHT
jgi:5-methylthioadenosine/S-adenosylhomocysteine deaminase